MSASNFTEVALVNLGLCGEASYITEMVATCYLCAVKTNITNILYGCHSYILLPTGMLILSPPGEITSDLEWTVARQGLGCGKIHLASSAALLPHQLILAINV